MSSSDHDPVLAHLQALSAAATTATGYAGTISAWGAELARRFGAGGQLLTCGNGSRSRSPIPPFGTLISHCWLPGSVPKTSSGSRHTSGG